MPAERPVERIFVWAGGAIFVAALVLTAWTYLVWFGVSRPFAGAPAIAADAALLTGFAFHHSLFARERVKRALAGLIPERLLRSVYVWIASLLLIAVDLAWQPVGGDFYRLPGWFALPFVLIDVAGVWLVAKSVGAISALELAGIRVPTVRDDLAANGVYGLVRHPLYLGWLLLVFGTPHLTGDRLTFAVLTTAYLCIAIPWEEHSLEQAFGEKYRQYKAQVRWRIVPGVY